MWFYHVPNFVSIAGARAAMLVSFMVKCSNLCRPVFVNTSQSSYMPLLKTAVNEADNLIPGSITSLNNGLLKVVLPPWGQPRLFFTVSSPLLVAKSEVTACMPASKSAAGSSKRP